MLDRTKLIRELQKVTDTLFRDFSHEYEIAQKTWHEIVADPIFAHKVAAVQAPWLLPSWRGKLDEQVPIEPNLTCYEVISVDGSQIYPDRHQGTNCFLLNIGMVELTYGVPGARVQLNSEPSVYIGEDEQELDASAELVNCKRQELEFSAGIALSKKKANQVGATPSVFLFDGSLIFWHLDSKDIVLRELFLNKYLVSLHQLFQLNMPHAGYISLPKSKELVNLIRLKLCNFEPEGSDAHRQVDHCIDTTITRFFLKPYTRSIIFKSHATICAHYPDHLHPHFFYLHVGDEIGRVEIPAWIAQNEQMVNLIAQILVDQSIKGRGYPVALAEAHEQAVVKGPDREFFYHLITKVGFEKKQRPMFSQKSLKKRGIGI